MHVVSVVIDKAHDGDGIKMRILLKGDHAFALQKPTSAAAAANTSKNIC